MAAHKFTLSGIIAIVLWSSLIGLTRGVSELLGPIGGAASIYTLSSVFLMLVMGVPRLKNYSVRYVILGGGLFVAYEICLSLALGFANSRMQAIEMSVINYLWPALTVFLTVLTSKSKPNFLVYPSIVVAFIGVVWCISGDEGLSATQLLANVTSNPLSYSLAFVGAFLWAFYCNLTQRISNGENPIVLFFIMTAAVLWVKYAISSEGPLTLDFNSSIWLVLSAMAMGGGYALWNYAIIGGNMILLATLSNFTPILSTFLSSLILGVTLGASFLQGVALVVISSLVCWWATKEKPSDASADGVKAKEA